MNVLSFSIKLTLLNIEDILFCDFCPSYFFDIQMSFFKIIIFREKRRGAEGEGEHLKQAPHQAWSPLGARLTTLTS